MSSAHWLTAIAFLLCVASWVAAGLELRHYTLLNDFWGLLFLAENLSLEEPRSLANGFYPPGYPLLLRALRGPEVLRTAFLLSVAAAATGLVVVCLWLRNRVRGWVVATAVLLLGVFPIYFQHALTAGPDMLVAVLCAGGGLGLHRALTRGRGWTAVLAGTVLATAGLMRHHGFLFAGAVVLGGVVCWPHRWKVAALACVPVGVAGAALAAINLAAGLPLFHTAQAFNVYKMFNPVDWYNLQSNYPDGVIDVIRLAPRRYAEAYWLHLTPQLVWLLPGVAAAWFGPHRRVGVHLLATVAVFLPLQAIGGSPRGPLPAVPFVALSTALALESIAVRVEGGASFAPVWPGSRVPDCWF